MLAEGALGSVVYSLDTRDEPLSHLDQISPAMSANGLIAVIRPTLNAKASPAFGQRQQYCLHFSESREGHVIAELTFEDHTSPSQRHTVTI